MLNYSASELNTFCTRLGSLEDVFYKRDKNLYVKEKYAVKYIYGEFLENPYSILANLTRKKPSWLSISDVIQIRKKVTKTKGKYQLYKDEIPSTKDEYGFVRTLDENSLYVHCDFTDINEEFLYPFVIDWFYKMKGYSKGETKVRIDTGIVDVVVCNETVNQKILCEVKLQNNNHSLITAVGQLLWYKFLWKKIREDNVILYLAATNICENPSVVSFLKTYDIHYLPIILDSW